MKALGRGHLRKMVVAQHGEQAVYQLHLDTVQIPLNALLGTKIQLRYCGAIFCIHCGKKTTRSFNRGYCYRCFRGLAQCDLCILKPDRCHYHAGTCRQPDWGERHCMITHYVYLANTSGLKVGLTRCDQIPVRWIDQGAVQALPIFETDTRQQAGFVESLLIGFNVAGQTNWRRMLAGAPEPLDLYKERDTLLDDADADLHRLRDRFGAASIRALPEAALCSIRYPLYRQPDKIHSLNLEKTAVIEGCLAGIKGQYLIFDSGVLNIRNFAGYEVEFCSETFAAP